MTTLFRAISFCDQKNNFTSIKSRNKKNEVSKTKKVLKFFEKNGGAYYFYLKSKTNFE